MSRRGGHTSREGCEALPAAWRRQAGSLENNAGIAQIAVAIDQVDLPHLNLPAIRGLHEPVSAPARQESRPIDAELADQEVGADHAGGALLACKYFDIRDQPHRAGFRRLRPSVTGAQAIDSIFHAPAVVEQD